MCWAGGSRIGAYCACWWPCLVMLFVWGMVSFAAVPALQSGVSYAQLPWVGAALALAAFGMTFVARAQDRKYVHRTASSRDAAAFAH